MDMIPNWPLPSFSIVVEWDNVRQSELERAHAMLRALRTQLSELRSRVPEPPDVLLLYDRNEVDAEIIRQSVEVFGPPDGLCRLRVVPVEGMHYYELKNAGAKVSSGEIVVFADSDVIPKPGWLEALLESFADPRVQVVGGQTYMSLNSLYSRAFAVFWFFGVRADRSDLVEHRRFAANNVAFRRTVLERFPFPRGELYRGNCVWLTHTLREKGIPIFRQYRAEAEHPPPVGVGNFFIRALWDGYDNVIIAKRHQPFTWWRVGALYYNSMRNMIRRLYRDHDRAGLTLAGSVAAFAIGTVYETVKLLGASITRINPRLLRRWLPS